MDCTLASKQDGATRIIRQRIPQLFPCPLRTFAHLLPITLDLFDGATQPYLLMSPLSLPAVTETREVQACGHTGRHFPSRGARGHAPTIHRRVHGWFHPILERGFRNIVTTGHLLNKILKYVRSSITRMFLVETRRGT